MLHKCRRTARHLVAGALLLSIGRAAVSSHMLNYTWLTNLAVPKMKAYNDGRGAPCSILAIFRNK